MGEVGGVGGAGPVRAAVSRAPDGNPPRPSADSGATAYASGDRARAPRGQPKRQRESRARAVYSRRARVAAGRPRPCARGGPAGTRRGGCLDAAVRPPTVAASIPVL